jgi:hypothetical protein
MSQEVDCYRPVTCYQTILRNFTDARYLIDKALTKAMKHRKPVLLEVCRYVKFVHALYFAAILQAGVCHALGLLSRSHCWHLLFL